MTGVRSDRDVAIALIEKSRHRFQRDIDHWNRTGKCLRHFALDTPPLFCEQCGKRWTAVIDGRSGREQRRRKREKR